MRGHVLTRLVIVALLGVLAVGATPPAYADSDDEATLAERYAPVLMLVSQDEACGPGEPYLPSDVDVMFDNPTIALRGPGSPPTTWSRWARPWRTSARACPATPSTSRATR